MPEPGDKLDRAYRDLAREEPPSSLDASILAASRRAVGARPEATPRRGFAARWGGPVSIAAVLVLGIAVALRMQVEQPGIETSMPQREAPAVIPKAIDAVPARLDAPRAEPEAPKPMPRAAQPVARERKEERKADVAPAPAPAKSAQPQGFAPEPPAILSAPVPAAPPMMQAAPAAAPVAKRAMAAGAAASVAADSAATNAAPPTPEAELERIAKLRAEGRDDEADRAIEAFRRKYPDYRIAEAMWERVRRK